VFLILLMHEEGNHYLKRLQTKENVPLLKFALRSVSAPQIHCNENFTHAVCG
jgi:hypothetical protein